MDSECTLNHLREEVASFRDARDWGQFHGVKRLAAAISIEASELQEIFLWDTDEQAEKRAAEEPGRSRAAEELSDVMIYCLSLANVLQLDVSEAIRRKLKSNDEKYPAEESRGNATKYTNL